MPSEEILVPKQLPSDTHEVIVVLESVHIPWEDVDTSPATHEVLLYRHTSAKEDDVAARIKNASVVITTTCVLPAETLKQAPYLRCIISHPVGTDHIDLAHCRESNIQVMNCTGCNTESVGEHALSLYLATRRSIVAMHNALAGPAPGRPNDWRAKGSMNALMRDGTGAPPRTCAQEVVGIVGSGAVGRHVAGLCRALGMAVAVSERKKGEGEGAGGTPSSSAALPASGGPGRLPFDAVLARSTVIFLALPLTPSTANTISAAELSLMRPDAIVVNVSRGGIVDEAAIVEALSSRRIFGYATDVFAREPAGGPEDSVLLSPEVRRQGLNLTLTAHLAWYSETTLLNQVRRTKENLRAYLDGNEAWECIVVGRRKV